LCSRSARRLAWRQTSSPTSLGPLAGARQLEVRLSRRVGRAVRVPGSVSLPTRCRGCGGNSTCRCGVGNGAAVGRQRRRGWQSWQRCRCCWSANDSSTGPSAGARWCRLAPWRQTSVATYRTRVARRLVLERCGGCALRLEGTATPTSTQGVSGVVRHRLWACWPGRWCSLACGAKRLSPCEHGTRLDRQRWQSRPH
jgi:hypothetical protein